MYKATVKLAHLVGQRALQGHLAGGHRTRPQLVFEPMDDIVVARPIVEQARHQEKAEATCTRGRAFWSSQRQNQVSGNV